MEDDEARKKRRVSMAAGTPRGEARGGRLRRASLRRSIMPDAHSPPLPPAPQEVMNTSWMVYRVSPLYNFQHDLASLQAYSTQLSASLEAARFKGTGVPVHLPASEQQYATGTARLSTLHNLALYEGEAEAVYIVVNKIHTNTPILKAILCSVGGETQTEAPFVSLPVLLVKGASVLSQQVIDWLSQQFDCRVSKLMFPPHDLMWIATEWAAPDEDAHKSIQKPLSLTYKPPGACKSLSNITYSVEPEAVRALQEMLRGESPTSLVTESALFSSLEEHFVQHFNIKLAAMTLVRVGTYAVFVGAEGRIKLLPLSKGHNEDSLLVLQYITYMATRNQLV